MMHVFENCFEDRRCLAEDQGQTKAAGCFGRLQITAEKVKNTTWEKLEAAYKAAGSEPSVRIETDLLDRVGRDYFPDAASAFVEELTLKLYDTQHSNFGGNVRFISDDEDLKPAGIAR